MLPPIDQLNALPQEAFFASVNELFETAPPLAKALWLQRPFGSYSLLIDAAESAIHNMSDTDRRVVVNAHPRIGAAQALLSAMSLREQGYSARAEPATAAAAPTADPTPLGDDAQVNARLSLLNDAYEAKFGFKFVVFVAGRPRRDIIPVIEARMGNAAEAELATGLDSMIQIARDRLRKLQA
ncbi:Oxo-4-hydroxy-4-carboxy-5-ureidoimidazoline decarboxylase [Entophlyctis helioformis]|nr:Oxo-4-hydroxy-4-carboxy-5-ureidoimidazoline decarboxylase [Entophlyctis helioformis]